MVRALAIPLLSVTLAGVGIPGAGAVQVGDPAPAFSLPGSDGETHALSDFAGRRGVVLAWFPKAFTPG